MFIHTTTKRYLTLIILIVSLLNSSVQVAAQPHHGYSSRDFSGGLAVAVTPTTESTPMPTASPTPTPTVLLTPTPTPTPTGELVPKPTSKVTPTPTPTGELVSKPTSKVTPTPEFEASLESEREMTPYTEMFVSEIAGEGTIVVYDYEDFVEALTEDNGYETIYLGADITMSFDGIPIHSSKNKVVIDGEPFGIRHNLHQLTRDERFASINIDSNNNTTKQITLRNMNVYGDNIYGVIFVYGMLTDVQVSFENVNYDGAQAATNRRGTISFSDCDIITHASGRGSISNLAEANRIELAGQTSIEARDIKSLLWPYGFETSIHIMEDAKVTAETSGYFLHADSTPPSIVVHPRAELSVHSESGFTHLGENVRNFLIDEDAAVHIIQDSPQTVASLRIERTFEMRPNSTVSISRFGVAGSVLYFPMSGGKAIFNDPKRVLLYNIGRPSIDFAADGQFEITTRSINMWQRKAPEIYGPTHIWNDVGGKLFTVEGQYSSLAPITITTSLGDNAPITEPLNETSFDLESSMLTTFGRLDLRCQPLDIESESIIGQTEAGATVTFRYTLADQTPITRTADQNGNFSIPINPALLEEGQEVIVEASIAMLTVREFVEVADVVEPRLAFTFTPNEIAFTDVAIPSSSTLISPGELTIAVEDTRTVRTPWRIDASIAKPLSATISESTYTLPNALIFVDDDKQENILNSIPLSIHREENPDFGETNISWGAASGVRLRISPDSIYSNISYTTTIQWALVDAP